MCTLVECVGEHEFACLLDVHHVEQYKNKTAIASKNRYRSLNWDFLDGYIL